MPRNRSVDWIISGNYFKNAVKHNVFLFIEEVKQRDWLLQRECMEFNLISARRRKTNKTKLGLQKIVLHQVYLLF